MKNQYLLANNRYGGFGWHDVYIPTKHNGELRMCFVGYDYDLAETYEFLKEKGHTFDVTFEEVKALCNNHNDIEYPELDVEVITLHEYLFAEAECDRLQKWIETPWAWEGWTL